jgi:hypothetical protein
LKLIKKNDFVLIARKKAAIFKNNESKSNNPISSVMDKMILKKQK